MKRGLEPLIYAFVLLVGIFIGKGLWSPKAANKQGEVEEAIQLISNQYVDSVAENWLKEQAIGLLLSELDPHSVFIPAMSLSSYNEPLQGNFQGIGIEYQIFRDTVMVIRVFKEGPAAKAGVNVGDRIIKADSFNLIKKENQEIATRIKGKDGTNVVLKILRGPKRKEENITVKRGKIDLPSIPYHEKLTKGIGYLKINQFGSNTKKEFDKAIEMLSKTGLSSLVIDLRGNTGGYLQTAVEMIDEFLDGGYVITYTQDRSQRKKYYKSTKGGSCLNVRVICMVDEQTASASELVCGAFQDNKRGRILGVRTYGKGLVQEHFGLSNGSAMRLTVARYYTPKGRNIQRPYLSGKLSKEDTNRVRKENWGILPDMIMDPLHDSSEKYDYREIIAEIMTNYGETIARKKTAQSIIEDKKLADYIDQALSEKEEEATPQLALYNTAREKILEQLIRNYIGETEYYQWITRRDPWIKQATLKFEQKP